MKTSEEETSETDTDCSVFVGAVPSPSNSTGASIFVLRVVTGLYLSRLTVCFNRLEKIDFFFPSTKRLSTTRVQERGLDKRRPNLIWNLRPGRRVKGRRMCPSVRSRVNPSPVYEFTVSFMFD